MTDAELERMFAVDATPGPALEIDAAHADALVEAALVGAGFGPGGGGGAGSAHTAMGTKLAIVGGVAVAVLAVVLFMRRDRGEHVATVMPDAALIDAPLGSGGDEEITIDPPKPDIDVPPKPAEKTDDVPAPSRAKPAVKRDVDDGPAKPEVDDLLGEANAKRAEKKWRESDVLYGRVVERAPKSLAAQTALVASGSLHLEHLRDPRGAAKRFRRALELAPTGAVAEDARWGLAEAARALHDDNAEAAALDDFLAHHPDSPLASRARARRAELP
jgi:hypothetical protein